MRQHPGAALQNQQSLFIDHQSNGCGRGLVGRRYPRPDGQRLTCEPRCVSIRVPQRNGKILLAVWFGADTRGLTANGKILLAVWFGADTRGLTANGKILLAVWLGADTRGPDGQRLTCEPRCVSIRVPQRNGKILLAVWFGADTRGLTTNGSPVSRDASASGCRTSTINNPGSSITNQTGCGRGAVGRR